MMDIPRNESDTIALFEQTHELHGWKIKHLQAEFPDAIISKNGQQLVAEFEHKSRNFLVHKHPTVGCDLIICWHNNWPESPLPVWALDELKGIGAICDGPPDKQLNIRRQKAVEAASSIASTLEMPVSRAVELVLTSTLARLERHIEAGSSPSRFYAKLLQETVED